LPPARKGLLSGLTAYGGLLNIGKPAPGGNPYSASTLNVSDLADE
jgi:hypothetical protein